jgi:hypothetical protein
MRVRAGKEVSSARRYKSEPIPAAKIEGLRQALAKGSVAFKNGSKVERVVEYVPVPDAEAGADGEPATAEVVHLHVTRPAGGVAQYPDDDSGYRSAYAMALRGPQPKKGITGRFYEEQDGEKWGDEVPW